METIHFPSLFKRFVLPIFDYIKKRRSLQFGIWLQKGYYLSVKYFHICELYVEICGQHWKLPTSPFFGQSKFLLNIQIEIFTTGYFDQNTCRCQNMTKKRIVWHKGQVLLNKILNKIHLKSCSLVFGHFLSQKRKF